MPQARQLTDLGVAKHHISAKGQTCRVGRRDTSRGLSVILYVCICDKKLVFATKNLMPDWLPLEPKEVLLPSLQDCIADGFESLVSQHWRHRFTIPDVKVLPGSICNWPEDSVDLATHFLGRGATMLANDGLLTR